MVILDKTQSRRGRHGHAPAGGYEARSKVWVEHITFYQFYRGILGFPDGLYRVFYSASSCHALPAPYLSQGEHSLFALFNAGICKLLHNLLPRAHLPSSPGDYYCFTKSITSYHTTTIPQTPNQNAKGFVLFTLGAIRLGALTPSHFLYYHMHE